MTMFVGVRLARLPSHANSVWTLLTYFGLFAYWGHRSSPMVLHSCIFVAFFSISFPASPIFFLSLSVSLCQVFLGLPLFLFPWGFHLSDCMSCDVCSWFPQCVSYPPPFSLLYFVFYWQLFGPFPSVLLDTLSDHFRCKILHRHLLMKVCILFSVFCVICHVSKP